MILCRECIHYRPDHIINGASSHNACVRVLDTITAPDDGEASIENNAYAEADAVLKVSPSFGCIMAEKS
jgi:hypothetical protein